MSGRGAPPKPDSRTRHKPVRGALKAAPGVGWQHGKQPPPPAGVGPAAKRIWGIWMSSWFAAFWTPSDLPGLENVAILMDAVRNGDLTRSTELRLLMDTYGITPKGQQDRRWVRPQEPEKPVAEDDNPYAHLRVIGA